MEHILTYFHRETLVAAMSVIGEEEVDRIINAAIDRELERLNLSPEDLEINTVWDPDETFVVVYYKELDHDQAC